MRGRAFACALGCALIATTSLATTRASAQTAGDQGAPGQSGTGGAAPATGAAPGETKLPEIEVTTPATPKKATAKANAKATTSGPSQPTGAVAADVGAEPGATEPQGPPPETATGPFQGYLATQTATGIKTDTPIREIPQSISVVGQDQIRDQGAQTVQEALRYTAGVVADGYGNDSRTDSPIIRGTEATEFLDGLRKTFNYYVFNYRTDPYFMERIEVLRGPASVLYGQAAVGGIYNEVSKRPQEQAYREITVDYGTFDFKQVRTDMTGALTDDGKWLYRIVALGRDAGTQVDYVDDDRVAFQPALTYKPVAGTSITLLGHFRNDHTGSVQQFFPHEGTRFPTRSGFIPFDAFIGNPGWDKYDTDAASGSLFVESQLNETFKLQHNMRYTEIHNQYNSAYPSFFYGDTGQGVNFPYSDPLDRTLTRIKWTSTSDSDIFNSDTNLTAKFATGPVGHKVLGGIDYANFQARQIYGDAIDNTPLDVYRPDFSAPESLGLPNYDPVTGEFTGFTPVSGIPLFVAPDQEVAQTGAYLQDQIRLGDWIAVVGLRHDWVDNWSEGSPAQKDEATTYRAGLMYELPIGLTPYVAYAQSFIPVVGLDRFGGTFDPQEGEMYEAGFKYTPPGTDFAINSAVYDISESNRLGSDPVNPNFSAQTGEVAIKGFEIEAIGNLTREVRAIAAYSYTDAKYVSGDQKGFKIESVPAHLASLWAMYTFHDGIMKGWGFGAGVRYIGSSWDGADIIETPAVTLVDASIAYDAKDWRWAVTGSNLEDKEYLSTCLARGDCFLGTSRTVITSLTYRF